MSIISQDVIVEIQQAHFDYTSLDYGTRVFVQECVASIQSHLKRTAEDIIAIGFDLIEVKSTLPHGQFIPWLQFEFQMSRTTAWRFMTAANEHALKDEVLPLITEESTREHAHPQAITRVQQTLFFRNHNNMYDGWFIDVQYSDGMYEIWFVVDLRAGYSGDDWWLEKIT